MIPSRTIKLRAACGPESVPRMLRSMRGTEPSSYPLDHLLPRLGAPHRIHRRDVHHVYHGVQAVLRSRLERDLVRVGVVAMSAMSMIVGSVVMLVVVPVGFVLAAHLESGLVWSEELGGGDVKWRPRLGLRYRAPPHSFVDHISPNNAEWH
jgi:hypothetical protein